VAGEDLIDIARAWAAQLVQEIRVSQNGATPTHAQMWPGPPGLTGGLGVSAQRPVGEEDLTDTGHVQPDQHVREKGGRQNGATPTPDQALEQQEEAPWQLCFALLPSAERALASAAYCSSGRVSPSYVQDPARRIIEGQRP